MASLEQMAGSTQAGKVLLAAVSHLVGKGKLSRFHSVSAERLARAEADVGDGLAQLGTMLDSAASAIASERVSFAAQSAEQRLLVSRAEQRGATGYATKAAAQAMPP